MPEPLLGLEDLLDSWLRQLRGHHRKSEQTLRSYRAAVEAFLRFCDDTDTPREITKANVLAWLAAQHDHSTATVRLRLTAIKLFSRWIADQDETDFDPDAITAIRPPKLEQTAVPDLSENEVLRILKTCDGRTLRDKRDKAILSLLAETGLRAAELLALDAADIDLDDCSLRVRHGKGGNARRVQFSPVTAAAIDRYNRARRLAIRGPAEGPLWISERGTRLSYTGLVAALKARAADAGVIGFHIHRLRHTAAVRWLRSGGSETGLRAQAGWSSNTMIARYAKTATEQLAAEEFNRLNLGIGEL
jgi:integrase/recombinase XerD